MKPVVYRIYTEYRPNLLHIAAEWFSGASLYHVDGLYQGVPEHGAILEVIGDDSEVDRNCARGLAAEIRTTNNQGLVILLVQGANVLVVENFHR